MSQTLIQPKFDSPDLGHGRFMVLIFNNETNSMEEVIRVLMRATGCDATEAYEEMWEAHHYGKAPVHFSTQPECERVSAIIAAIGVKTEIRPEWED